MTTIILEHDRDGTKESWGFEFDGSMEEFTALLYSPTGRTAAAGLLGFDFDEEEEEETLDLVYLGPLPTMKKADLERAIITRRLVGNPPEGTTP